tara:strand:- start:1242 stop:2201 length:960 start_codon:yes stop_codon:yes gene_type:complete
MLIINRTLIITLLIVFVGCAKQNSIIEISDKDIKYFDAIIARSGEEVRFFPSYDKVQLACTIIHTKELQKGVVLFIHGIGARSNLYLPLADEIAKHGYKIYLLDIRGHGYSKGLSGHMPFKDTMAKDIKYFYEYVLSMEGENQNYIAMGHSLGTYIWMNTLDNYADIHIDAFVFISGGSIHTLNSIKSASNGKQHFSYVNKWKLFLSIFNQNIKPIHLIFPDVPQIEYSGLVQDYSFSFFSMFEDYENRFTSFYEDLDIPILMISGDKDELFEVQKLEDAYSMIHTKNKKLVILENETHTSIIWASGVPINNWLIQQKK